MFTEFHLDPALSGDENMHADESSFHRLNVPSREGVDFSCVRVYEWTKPTLSVGLAQVGRDIFNDRVIQDGIGVVSRITGGRVVLHHQEITYSVVGSVDGIFGSGLRSAYDSIASILRIFLEKLGLDPNSDSPSQHSSAKNSQHRSLVCYDSLGFKEISLGGRKLIGSAQKRGKYAFLQHGSIPFIRHGYRVEDYLQEGFLPPSPGGDYVFLKDFVDIDLKKAKEILLDTFREEIYKKIDQKRKCLV